MRDENKGPKNEFIETLEVFGRIFNILRRYIFLSLLPAIAIMLLAHLIFENPTSEDADELIHYAKLADNEKAVLEQRKIKLDIQPLNIKYNREYIIAYLDKYRTGQQHREKLHELLEFYTLKQSATNIFKYDLSNYCLGFIYSNEKKYPKAIEHYIKVKDPDFDYLNNSFGFSYIQEQDFDKAEFYLEKSISISNNLDAAYSNLAKAYFRSKKYEKLDQLADNPEVYNVISWKITRFLFIRDGKIGQYIYHLFLPSLKIITLIGFSGASIIAVFWLLFIRKIDYFDPAKKRYMLMLFCLGILTSFGVFVIDDFISIFTHIELSNKFLPDLFYCIFKIGLVEEVVKIIPFFAILFFTKQINESVDYFIYASVCAIGFAFAENLLYFSPYGISFISARGMISVSVHMIFSSITVYGLFYSKYKKNGKYPVLYFLLFLFLAALLHGLFDFFLVGPNYLRVLAIFSIAIFMFTIRIYSNILTTALNFSKFWNTAETEFEISNAFFLASFITYIGALEYFTLAWKCGPSSANIDFGQSLPLYILLIPYLASTIGILYLKQGAWINIFCLNNNKIEKLFVNGKI